MKKPNNMPAASEKCAYGLSRIPDGKKWSGVSFPVPPAIGTKVKINFNGLGNGEVIAYFFEHGFVGVQVKLYNNPDWHVKQCKGDWHEGTALVFGIEIDPI